MDFDLTTGGWMLLGLSLAMAFAFEMVNGCPDTANVLSSGIAGTMAADRSGLQGKTLRNIAIAWVLTLPVTMALSALFFMGLSAVFL